MKPHSQAGEAFFSMALAYIEVGRVAASASMSIKCLGGYENAVAYQLFHAMELFYKSMIANTGQSVRHTHDLCELENQYKSCFSDPLYHFENPFDFSSYEPEPLNQNEMQLAQSHLEKFKPTWTKYGTPMIFRNVTTRSVGTSAFLGAIISNASGVAVIAPEPRQSE